MQIRLQDTKVRKQIQITTFATFFLPDFRTFGGSLGRSTVAHFARKVRGGEYCGGQARAENPTKSCPKALVMFATCSWPSLCEQSELQCWRRNRRLCGPAQISAARALVPLCQPCFFAKQQVAKHAHMINEQSAKRSVLKGQPVYSPGQHPGYQRINTYAL